MQTIESPESDPLKTTMHALDQLCGQGGFEAGRRPALNVFGSLRQLPSAYQVGPAAVASVAAQALAAASIWEDRTGERQTVGLEFRRVMASFQGEQHLRVDGRPLELHSPLTGYYPTKGGGWVQLHTGFTTHRDIVLRELGTEDDREAVAAALLRVDADEVEARLVAAGAAASRIRTPEEWRQLPQAAALSSQPVFSIERIGAGPAQPVGGGSVARQPLSGVRVLDLSRVIAGPVAARTLAQHGADVLAIGAEHLANILPFQIDTGRGKRFANLDLRSPQGRAQILQLVSGADVFLQAYRPGSLDSRGLGPAALAQLRPGIICVDLCAYGHEGQWASRRGYDSIVQSGTGIAWTEGRAAGADSPGKLPCQALDHASGYIAAFATMLALQRRAREGGSWRVRVSLAQTGRWLTSLGVHGGGKVGTPLAESEIAEWVHHLDSPYGQVRAIAPAEQLPACPPSLSIAPAPDMSEAPQWAA